MEPVSNAVNYISKQLYTIDMTTVNCIYHMSMGCLSKGWIPLNPSRTGGFNEEESWKLGFQTLAGRLISMSSCIFVVWIVNNFFFLLLLFEFTGCKYLKSEWSECDVNGEKRRIDTLRDGSLSNCEPTKTFTKKCHKANVESKCKL